MRPARIVVLAGVNGAGKSSVLGEMLVAAGIPFFNPDAQTRSLLQRRPELVPDQANSMIWQVMVTRLERAIAEQSSFFFETTLGAHTIPRLLAQAADSGTAVELAFVGLSGPELHIQRVAARVAAGGHDIPEAKIRERYVNSMRNLVQLIPKLTTLRVFDNSQDRDAGDPVSLVEIVDQRLVAWRP
ncbi:MAG: zeta toxin family protein, partial [Nevskiales bacterium]